MKSYNSIFITALAFGLLISCNTKRNPNTYNIKDIRYFDDGNVRSIVVCPDSFCKIFKVIEFHSNGNLNKMGYLFKNASVGPLHYFDENNTLILYNARDVDDGVYFVLKYENGKLIKTEGVPISPKYYKEKDKEKLKYYFFIAAPSGFKQTINVTLSSKPFEYSILAGKHVLEVNVNSRLNKGEKLKVECQLIGEEYDETKSVELLIGD